MPKQLADLDKWQQREVAQYAKDNDVSEEAALKVLHPDEEVPADAEDEQAPAEDSKAKASPKVSTSK